MEDTIVAISTSVGEGAISIIRLSGHDALNIASKVFTKDLTKVDSHTIHYGFITSNNEKIDEVLVSVMKAPKTFTREDIVEINCHGGIATTNTSNTLLLWLYHHVTIYFCIFTRNVLGAFITLTNTSSIFSLLLVIKP